ncbi:ATP-binding protein [Rhizocola hellebori]|nr:helix-turn-helix domain-containing protein [Rhizocola hellebori]
MTQEGEPSASFAALLRARRHAAGLTQAELAERAGLGERTLRDLERGRSARPQRTTVELLAKALDLRGSDHLDFLAAARGVRGLTPVAPVRPIAGDSAFRLPAPPELLGREGDLAGLSAHLTAQPGLTTLVGLAGVGKSALALSIANRLEPLFPGGVAGISLAIGDSAFDITQAICTVLGIARPAQIAARLADPVLLLVDGLHRAEAVIAPVLADLMGKAPNLRVLASARAPLGLPGEMVWPVQPLALPPADLTSLDQVRSYPASAMFMARWSQVRGSPPADVEVSALVALVRRLGGLPLAIELAAARGRVLDPPEMLIRYGDRLLELGDSDATTTLRDVVTASYRLLDPGHRWALRRLSGFGYRWSIELAEELLGPDHDLVPILERLVELGLVQVRGSGAFRFFLLDVVKAYAIEHAEAAGELGEIRRQHAVVFARFAARMVRDLTGTSMAAAVSRLDDVASDLWAALGYSAEHDPHTALCLASKLPRWWRFRGRDQQGRQWLRRLLDDPRTADADPHVRTWAQLGVAQLAAEHNAGIEELHRAEYALEQFMLDGDVTGELATRTLLLVIHQGTGDYAEARHHGELALALATKTGRVRDMAVAQNNLIWHDTRISDLVSAQRRLAAVDRLSVRCGDHQLRALARANLAEVLRLDGRFEESIRVAVQAAEMLADVGHPGQRRRLQGLLGLSYAHSGRLDEAEKVLADLRSQLPPDLTGGEAEDWDCAMVEATIAAARGQRLLAATWFGAAVQGGERTADIRDVAEALVGLAMTADDPAPALARLDELCRRSGIVLTPREQAMLPK